MPFMTHASLDTQRQSTDRSRWGVRDVGLISVFVARAATLNLIPAIPVGPQGVPSTLQPLALCLEALRLGGPRGSQRAAIRRRRGRGSWPSGPPATPGGSLNLELAALAGGLMLPSIPAILGCITDVCVAARARGLGRNPIPLAGPVVISAVAFAHQTGDALAARGILEQGSAAEEAEQLPHT